MFATLFYYFMCGFVGIFLLGALGIASGWDRMPSPTIEDLEKDRLP